MASKLFYLLIDWETFNQLPALEQVSLVQSDIHDYTFSKKS